MLYRSNGDNTKELEIFESGADPSISRTYHLCPNTSFYPYDMDPGKFVKPDYTSGSHYSITLFRPNINILCGYDGALENNCTFFGGFSSICIRPKIIDYGNQLINTTAENITIKGIAFIGGTSGPSVLVENVKGSLKIEDCYFHVSSFFIRLFPFHMVYHRFSQEFIFFR